jgi:hypothetical protein
MDTEPEIFWKMNFYEIQSTGTARTTSIVSRLFQFDEEGNQKNIQEMSLKFSSIPHTGNRL